MSSGARTTVAFEGAAGSWRQSDRVWFTLSATTTSGLPSRSKSPTAGQGAFQSWVKANEPG